MIRRLSLTNWRAYDHVDLELRPGTTFVVARNGIGKSSLIEGAAWALFGDAAGRPAGAVRIGTKAASATVDVLLPDGRTLSVTRDLPLRLAKGRQAPVRFTVDGQAAEGDLETLIREAFGADGWLLARLTMLRGREHLDPDLATLDLQAHLSQFFGIQGLQQALLELDTRRRELERRIHQIKQTVGVSPRQLNELRQRHEQALALAAEREGAHRKAVEASSLAAQVQREAEAYEAWRSREQTRLVALSELAQQYSAVTGSEVTAQGFESALEEHEIAVTTELDARRRRHGLMEGKVQALQSALAELDQASGACPVCRRPLSSDDAAHARTGHQHELVDLLRQRQLLAAEESELAERLRVARDFRQRLRRIPAREAPPTTPALSISDATARQSAAEAAAEAEMTELVRSRSVALTAAAALETAEADQQATSLLYTEYERLGLLSAANDAVTSVINRVLDDTIGPLVDDIAIKWKRLFFDRGPLMMSGKGELSRDINGETLPFKSFSTGEKMAAQLLLRLMVVNAATRAAFCWVDEPLEHLDPDTRRQIASMLAATPTTTGVKQVLVTTYEEPLVRRLAGRRPDEVEVLYVRPEGPY